MSNKERFISLFRKVNRPGVEDFLQWLETTDFYTAPASTRYHGAYPEGLVEHSLDVYDEATRIKKAYPELNISEESIIITTLPHDICKVDLYSVEKRNRKNSEGKWESYDAYTTNEKFCYGGHGSKSVYLIQHFIKLTPEEAVAIQCHMSSWEDGASKYVGSAFEQFPLAWLVHIADESATFILNRRSQNVNGS